ncbi:DUF1592 domain-containing protein [Tautonia plasticadhaerens]|uniref:Cytochrome c domain-containing protein n=1 Tax=Tautonia plasticadhaerens TaxID=2527974 RepID=A0A518H5R3_9BACT|nr:DUF1592 domain-containing protein [Tautonia plasticadhaerens]QDV36158.1 hypothetical protein ElP_40720 [Tautonia plasticadhaerens]
MRAIHALSTRRVVGPSRARSPLAWGLLLLLASSTPGRVTLAEDDRALFEERILPILEDNCFTCHGLGITKGGVDLEALAFSDGADADQDREAWLAVLKNVRAGIMPPADEPAPTPEEREQLQDWIKAGALGLDPDRPDPGRVTVRRLNRVEYRNTIRDLMGVDFDTTAEFPPDDTGHGFDTIGDVLTISPLLMEKYIAAAQEIVSRVVPTTSGVVPERTIPGSRFRDEGDEEDEETRRRRDRSRTLSYYEPARVSTIAEAEYEGDYQLILSLSAHEQYVEGKFDSNLCLITFEVDGEKLLSREFSQESGESFRFEFDLDWQAGDHDLAVRLEPLTPDEEQVRSLTMRVDALTVRGPMGEEHLVRPEGYERFFPGEVPEDESGRRRYARDLLDRFATRAFRRPAGAETADRLADIAMFVAGQENRTFESGMAQAMVAVLASPRFLFREEGVEPGSLGPYPRIDEYALASRLSYFLWSTMPDDELFRLAERSQLRENLDAQLSRMLADDRSEQFIRNFVGQWLQARDVDSVQVNTYAVLSRDTPPDPDAERNRDRFRELRRKDPENLTDEEEAELEVIREAFFRSRERFERYELDGSLRRAMRAETELLFEHIVREDRPLIELLDSGYTFLNDRLATLYGIEGVEGDEMRKVDLPPDSPRGGVLTQGTVLTVTSNPDRTSPVKRGLFILENILGTPPAPPPPNIPSLEEAGKEIEGRTPTLREAMELHRSDPLCNSCHNRMDPLGLALEHFNALGMYREQERSGPIDASGVLITGEPFDGVKELKRILAEDRRLDFYRCLTEKMLTYALGRGLEYPDEGTVDAIVDRLEARGGRATELIAAIIDSAPFQRRRDPGHANRDAAGVPADPDDRVGEE